jgi:hypothetical protein
MSDAESESLFARLDAARAGKPLPPVDRWHPTRHGESGISIDVDGRWYYRGSEIRRPEMVRLFSTVLRRDPDGIVLVTPAERLSVVVEDAPFVAIDFDIRGADETQELAFETNVGDIVVADADHPILLRGTAANPRPYVVVRDGLEARISRAAYYRLIELAHLQRERDATVATVSSGGEVFELGRYMLG